MSAAMVQNFLRYRRRFRVGLGNIMPLSSEKYPKLTGFPPNLIHETDLYQSIIPFLEGQNADGLVFSMTGERLLAPLVVSDGHTHETDKTALPWWPIASWQLPANGPDGAGFHPQAAQVKINAGISPNLGVVLCKPQPGTTKIAIRACITGPYDAGAAAYFQLKFNLYGDNDPTFVSGLPIHSLVWDLSITHDKTWLETQPIDISGLPFTAERLLVCLASWNFNVAAGSPYVAVYQIQIGAVE
jgi:hypothetical protein